MYIEEICKYHNHHKHLSGIELFRAAINDMLITFSREEPGYTEKKALEMLEGAKVQSDKDKESIDNLIDTLDNNVTGKKDGSIEI